MSHHHQQHFHKAAPHKSYTANQFLPHHSNPHSLGAPRVRISAELTKVFAGPENHHGANHQHFRVKVTQVLKFEGGQADLVGQELFVALRFGDGEGLSAPIADLQVGQPIEIQGEYISAAEAYPTEDNADPILPVLHFTHHPLGYVRYHDETYS